MERADHSRVFAERGRPGFVQRPYSFHGHEFARRTYYYHGRAYDRFYRGYDYHGVYINVYAPARFYSVGFYGWAYNPWPRPVYYSWGFGSAPWYGYYNYYFTPYASYPTPSLWLTDYMISQDLSAQYQAMQDAQTQGYTQSAAGGPPALTPEVKQMIADEVKGQLALENSEAQQTAQNQDIDPNSSGIGRMMSDGHPHVFVAGTSLDVVDASGTECSITDGDALQLPAPPAADATAANLVVLSSKGGKECQKSATVTIALSDLQDMQNHMRETIDQGLQELQAKQGSGGLPPAPPSATVAPIEVAYAKEAPPADPAGAAAVNQQLQEADTAEQDVAGQAQHEAGGPSAASSFTPSVPPPPPLVTTPATTPPTTITIALGQTIDQVTTALGQPTKVIDLGVKKIYQYPDMKITFRAGKVADVE